MKFLFSLAVLATACIYSQASHALPASNNVSAKINATATGTDPGRLFDVTRTDATVNNGDGCSSAGLVDICPGSSDHCWRNKGFGYYSNGNKCCGSYYICRDDGTIDPELEARAERTETAEEARLDKVFSNNDDRSAAFWAYINTTIRSPNAGRTLMMDAKLDMCIGFTNLDSLISTYGSDPYGGWSACTGSGYCGSVKNAYCTANSNQVCIDRCNCKYQSALVGLGYADPGCSNL